MKISWVTGQIREIEYQVAELSLVQNEVFWEGLLINVWLIMNSEILGSGDGEL